MQLEKVLILDISYPNARRSATLKTSYLFNDNDLCKFSCKFSAVMIEDLIR